MGHRWSSLNPALRELALANYRELVRDAGGFFLMVLFPFFMFGLIALVALPAAGGSYVAGVLIPAQASEQIQQVVDHLRTIDKLRLVNLTETDGLVQLASGELTAIIRLPLQLDTDPITITVSEDKGTKGSQLRKWVQQPLDRQSRKLVVVRDVHGNEPLAFKAMLPFTLFMCYWFVSFYSIGFRIIQLRQRGTLKLLGLTPLSRLTFIIAQVPARLGLALLQLTIVAFVGYMFDFLSADRIPGALLSSILGLLMLFSFGYLAGGVLKTPEVALILPMGLMPLVAAPSGLMLPPHVFPAWVNEVYRFVPFTYLADAFQHFLTGSELRFSLATDYLVMATTALGVTLLTAKVFKWDQGEGR